MATGVKPRDEDSSLTRSDLEAIQDAMKSKKFRDLLSEYCDEVRDPANQAIYQKEMTQLEKERGYDVTFINPNGGYVIKTSVAGDRKAFINICSNDNVDKPSCNVQEINGKKGMNWQLPYTIIPPRDDFDNKRERCVIYDVVFHSDTLRMAEVNKRFRELVNKTALEGLQNTYKIEFDCNNCRFPKSNYKGMTVPAVIRKQDPNFVPPSDEENPQISSDILDKLYPQHIYQKTNLPEEENFTKEEQHRKKAKNSKKQFTHASDEDYTVPKYVIKQQKNVDFQDFTIHKNSKQYSAIPNHITVEIYLPLLSSTKDCVLDVREKSLTLHSEKPAKYKLNLKLPYHVNEESGSATFDLSKHMLIVKLPVIRKALCSENTISIKGDSGVESEDSSNCEEESKLKNIEELSSMPEHPTKSLDTKHINHCSVGNEDFLLPNIGYTFPPYTHNVLDEIVAFTFHIKNTDPGSVKVKTEGNKVFTKFASVGAGFVPVHYAAVIVFNEGVRFKNATGEAWDNNVILQLEVTGGYPEKFQIGSSEDEMKTEYFDVSHSQLTKTLKDVPEQTPLQEDSSPSIEVTNFGRETNIVVSSNNHKDVTEDEDEFENEIVWTESNTSINGAKSILRKPISMTRSFSESSAGDIASSMDYISSDYILEESSLKKTVRFSDVIAKQFYRYNSSIEGQKRKNQKKKSKKRNQERRKSESEAEDDASNSIQTKSRPKSTLKQRHDSGVVDTSDAEEFKTTMSDCDLYDTDENGNKNETSQDKDNMINKNDNTKEKQTWKTASQNSNKAKYNNTKHNTDLYDPNGLNKGQYLEVKFKNDLIFDLDM